MRYIGALEPIAMLKGLKQQNKPKKKKKKKTRTIIKQGKT